MSQVQMMPQKGDGIRMAVGVVGTLVGVSVILVIIGVMLYVGKAPDSGDAQKLAEQRMAKLREVRERDQHTLSTYGWVDRSKGVVRIPIEAAMEKIVEESTR